MVFHWSLRDSKFPKVSRALLRILANLKNTIVWIVSILPLLSNSLNLLSKILRTILSTPTTIEITVSATFYCCFLGLRQNPSIFYLSLFFYFYPVVGLNSYENEISIFLSWSGLDDPFLSQNHREFDYYYFTLWEFFTSALADGFPLEFERQQVSSSLLDTSQYSGRSKKLYISDSLLPPRYFQVPHSWYQYFGDCTKSNNYNWYKRHFHDSQFFQSPSKVEVLKPLFASFQLYSVVCRDNKVHNPASSLFFADYCKVWSSGRDYVICLYLMIPEEFVCVILQDRFWVVHIPFVRMVKLQFLAQFPVDHLDAPVVPSLILFLC